MNEVYISYIPPMRDSRGNVVTDNQGRSVKPNKGTRMYRKSLKDVLSVCPNLDPYGLKGGDGCVILYLKDVMGISDEDVDDDVVGGICGLDIDHFPREQLTRIFESLPRLSEKFPNLLGAYFSSSYNDPSRDDVGMHLFLKLDVDRTVGRGQFKSKVRDFGGYFAWLVYNELGIDIRCSLWKVRDVWEKSGLDEVSNRISQRYFLNHSPIWWNDAWTDELLEYDRETVKEWFNEKYEEMRRFILENHIFVKVGEDGVKKNTVGNNMRSFRWFGDGESEFKVIKCRIKTDMESVRKQLREYTPETGRFPHEDRYRLAYFLAAETDWESDEIFEYLYGMCPPYEFRRGKNPLIESLRSDIAQGMRKYRGREVYNPGYRANAVALFKSYGIDIEAEIERVYSPIDYDFDRLFEEVWEEHKDDPVYNVHYNPRNYHHILLKRDEHLSDHSDELLERIRKYQMTYLLADCMTGKTFLALVMDGTNDRTLFDDCMFMRVDGHNVDLCVPYNSVADNKSKKDRMDIRRVVTQNIKDFDDEKRNVFIWNTVKPLYDEYFAMGIVKRLILFFDESHKIVTDDYRWETVVEMFKALPMMYKHFVFMTGTPSYELDYLKRFFPDYGIVHVDKESVYERRCDILKYNSFGNGDRVKLIESEIENGRLPLIYSNTKNTDWKNAIRKVNMNRVERGERVLRVLEYERDNSDNLKTVNENNSIKEYDVVIATAYCSVGIDFKRDDERPRVSIVDFASERGCTFHDIWQFTLRNRDQDTHTKIITLKEKNQKLFNYRWVCERCEMMARIHTHKGGLEVDEDLDIGKSLNTIYRTRKFGKLTENGFFEDDRNVTLLTAHYKYRTLFGNIHMIRHMMELRGVKVREVDMSHKSCRRDDTVKRDIYRFFVDNFKEIEEIQLTKGKYDRKSHHIPMDENGRERIEDGKVYTRHTKYMNWLIGRFCGKDEWLEILKERDYMSQHIFDDYNRMMTVVKNITKEQLNTIKRMKGFNEDEIDLIVTGMVVKIYRGCVRKEDFMTEGLMDDVVEGYKGIIGFILENKEFIDILKGKMDDGERLCATHKMMIVIEQKKRKRAKEKMSEGGRKGTMITVRYIKNGKEKTFGSVREFCDEFGCSRQAYYNFKNGRNSECGKVVQLVE